MSSTAALAHGGKDNGARGGAPAILAIALHLSFRHLKFPGYAGRGARRHWLPPLPLRS